MKGLSATRITLQAWAGATEKRQVDFWNLWLLRSRAKLFSLSRPSFPVLRGSPLEQTDPEHLPILTVFVLCPSSLVGS